MEQRKAQVPGLISAQYRLTGPKGSMPRSASRLVLLSAWGALIKVGMELFVGHEHGRIQLAAEPC